MYTFSNEKVRLRAVTGSDMDDFLRWFSDTAMLRNLGGVVHPHSEAEEREWLERVVGGNASDNHFGIDAIDGAQPKHIGGCSLFRVQHRNASAEMGILIGETDYWGKGYGTAAHQLLLEFGFGELNLHRVHLRVYDFNLRGRRSYEKLGYHLDATAREAVYREGRYYDVHHMSLLRDEWEALRRHEA